MRASISDRTRKLDRGRNMEWHINGLGPLPGVRRVSIGESRDIERHLEMGTDRNHLDAKIEAVTGAIEVECGSSEDPLIASLQRRASDSVIDFGLHSLYESDAFWIWGNIYDTKRQNIQRSICARRCMISDSPNEFEVDDVSIKSYSFEAERAWQFRNGHGLAWDEWTATSLQTTFPLTQAAVAMLEDGTLRYISVFENGVEVWPDEVPFTVSAGNLTFTTGRVLGRIIQVLYPYLATSDDEVPGDIS